MRERTGKCIVLIVNLHNMTNKVDMADLCELAHEFTVRECTRRKIKYEVETKEEVRYSAKGQKVFDYYYDTITNILRV
jgi:hypothetical protein